MPENNTTPTPAIHVMLDIETLGTTPGSAITSIGAVKFTPEAPFEQFYCRVDIDSCTRRGMKVDPSTVLWWMRQNETARLELCEPGKHIARVLQDFSNWLPLERFELWGNGAGFDNALLAAAYDALEIMRPWTHAQDRCYRTMKNENRDVSIDPYRVGTHHNALDDATSQAHHLMAIWRKHAARNKALSDAETFLKELAEFDTGEQECLASDAKKVLATIKAAFS